MTHNYSLRTLTDLKPEDHLCCLYETEEEHRALNTLFLRQGLERDEKVLYILSTYTAETILDYLRSDGLKVETYLASQQLNILSANDTYTREGIFDPARMIALLSSETERALAEGYSALRVAGEAVWVLQGLPGSERLIEYESRLCTFFPYSKCLALCLYDRRHLHASLLLNVLTTHPTVVIGTEVYDNFYYIPATEFLRCDHSAVTLSYWLDNLKARKQTEEALQKAYTELELRVKERTAELSKTNAVLREQITERKQIEMALRESEERFQLIARATNDAIWDWNLVTNEVWWGEGIKTLFHYMTDEIGSDATWWYEHIHPEDKERVILGIHAAIRSGVKYWSDEYRYRRADNSYAYIFDRGYVIHDGRGKPIRMVGAMLDITERKQAEEQIKAALREKDVLLKEIHHRVKNNLQIVSSLLDLQSNHVKDPQALLMFMESQNRIKSIALIHENLYQSENLTQIDFDEYIRNMVTHLFRSYGVNPDIITFKVYVENILLNLDKAIPCGLIIHELVSNSLKYAFPEGRGGEIRIKLGLDNCRDGFQTFPCFMLIVSDNGVGFPENLDFRDTNSLGLQLVIGLTHQLKGTIELDRSRGTTFKIIFAE